MGLFEIRVTLWGKDKASKPKIKSAVSLILANNEEHLLVWNLCRQDVSLLCPKTYKETPQNEEENTRAILVPSDVCIGCAYVRGKCLLFHFQLHFQNHLGWYLMKLVISSEMHKGEYISYNLS